MIFATIAALAATTATATSSPPFVAVHVASAASPGKAKSKATGKPDLAAMLAMVDKLFPPGPTPDPARLMLARTTVETLWPNGTYGRIMEDMLGGMYQRVMAMRGSDFGAAAGKGSDPTDNETFHQMMIKDDPYFDQRVAIIRRVMTEEMKSLSAIVEPRLRDGLARAAARRFDARQLTDINAFFATSSGRALGGNLMSLWVDPDTMRSMLLSAPDMIAAMPQVMARIERETASLPKPKAKTPAAKARSRPAKK